MHRFIFFRRQVWDNALRALWKRRDPCDFTFVMVRLEIGFINKICYYKHCMNCNTYKLIKYDYIVRSVVFNF